MIPEPEQICPKQVFELHLGVAASDSTPVALLNLATGLGTGTIKRAMQRGALWHTRAGHTQRLRRAKRPLAVGDELHFYWHPKVQAEVPEEPTLVVDGGVFSIWYKPPGLRSQGSRWGDHCTLHRWAELHLRPERPALVVHRLDRAAAGLMVLAHSKKAAAHLAAQFRQRQVIKWYHARVHGLLQERQRITTPVADKAADSEVVPLAQDAASNTTEVAVRISTGRKHQIRIHLAEAGHPLLGDRLYGPPVTADAPDLALVSTVLGFTCPDTGARRVWRLQRAPEPTT